MIGLTEYEIETRQKELNRKYYGDNSLTPKNLLMPWTEEDTKEYKELSFRSWCNSCLIYGMESSLEPEELRTDKSIIGKTVLELYKVSLERALELAAEQKERFKTAKVRHSVYTDGEGCSYNSCEW